MKKISLLTGVTLLTGLIAPNFALAEVQYTTSEYSGCSLGYKLPEGQAALDAASQNYYQIQALKRQIGQSQIAQSQDDQQTMQLLGRLNDVLKVHWQIFSQRAVDCQTGGRISVNVPENPVTILSSIGSSPQPTSSPEPNSSPNPNPPKSADELRNIALAAARANPRDCADSVATAAEAYGIQGLPPKESTNADAQIAYIRQNWRKISADEAIQLANQGIFVVANMNSEELNDGNGHTAVVAPGGGIKRGNKEYPALIGGAKNPRASSVLSPRSQDGRISVRWALPAKAVDQDRVDYRTP